MSKTISSQKYLDDSIVAAKRAAADYGVSLVPVTLDGDDYLVVCDGHHSLAAAKADGEEPDFTVLDRSNELCQHARRDPQGFMASHQHDAEWYDIATGKDVW
jgi:hypothetical protein